MLIRWCYSGDGTGQTGFKAAGKDAFVARGMNTFYSLDMDARKLTNPTEITNAVDLVKALEPKKEGFIAHELQQHLPEAVEGHRMNYSMSVPTPVLMVLNNLKSKNPKQFLMVQVGLKLKLLTGCKVLALMLLSHT